MDFLVYSDPERSTLSLALTTLVTLVQLRPHCCLHNSMPLIHIKCGVLVTAATSNFTIPHISDNCFTYLAQTGDFGFVYT